MLSRRVTAEVPDRCMPRTISCTATPSVRGPRARSCRRRHRVFVAEEDPRAEAGERDGPDDRLEHESEVDAGSADDPLVVDEQRIERVQRQDGVELGW